MKEEIETIPVEFLFLLPNPIDNIFAVCSGLEKPCFTIKVALDRRQKVFI